MILYDDVGVILYFVKIYTGVGQNILLGNFQIPSPYAYKEYSFINVFLESIFSFSF